MKDKSLGDFIFGNAFQLKENFCPVCCLPIKDGEKFCSENCENEFYREEHESNQEKIFDDTEEIYSAEYQRDCYQDNNKEKE